MGLSCWPTGSCVACISGSLGGGPAQAERRARQVATQVTWSFMGISGLCAPVHPEHELRVRGRSARLSPEGFSVGILFGVPPWAGAGAGSGRRPPAVLGVPHERARDDQ